MCAGHDCRGEQERDGPDPERVRPTPQDLPVLELRADSTAVPENTRLFPTRAGSEAQRTEQVAPPGTTEPDLPGKASLSPGHVTTCLLTPRTTSHASMIPAHPERQQGKSPGPFIEVTIYKYG